MPYRNKIIFIFGLRSFQRKKKLAEIWAHNNLYHGLCYLNVSFWWKENVLVTKKKLFCLPWSGFFLILDNLYFYFCLCDRGMQYLRNNNNSKVRKQNAWRKFTLIDSLTDWPVTSLHTPTFTCKKILFCVIGQRVIGNINNMCVNIKINIARSMCTYRIYIFRTLLLKCNQLHYNTPLFW